MLNSFIWFSDCLASASPWPGQCWLGLGLVKTASPTSLHVARALTAFRALTWYCARLARLLLRRLDSSCCIVGTDSSYFSELRNDEPQGSVLDSICLSFTICRGCQRCFRAVWCPSSSVYWRHAGHQAQQVVRDVTAGHGACMTSVNNRCASRRLQLHTTKTEVMWLTAVWVWKEPQEIGNYLLLTKTSKLDPTSPSTVAEIFFFDTELNMKQVIICRILRPCFYNLRRLSVVPRARKGDNALQRAMRVAARPVCDLSPSQETTQPPLKSLR